jgi:hypothetical protein
MGRRHRIALVATVTAVLIGLGGAALAAVGQSRTEGTKYDRGETLVQEGPTTYMFFARSQADCNRLAGCNPDNQHYDMYVKTSPDGGKTFGPATLVATNPGDSGFFGRTLAATLTSTGINVFWASGGSQNQLYVVKETAPGAFSPATPVMSAALTDLSDVFNVEAVTLGGQTYLYTEEMEAPGYGIYARTYDGATAGGPNVVALNKNIPKAIVDRNGGVKMTFVDATAYPTVALYVDSSADGLVWPGPQLVQAIPGESDWDPNLVQKPNGQYYLFFAPDRQEGAGRQQVALRKSNDFVSWTAPHDLTPGYSGGVEYWDYWPEGFVYKNQVKLFYTSERGTGSTPPGTGHIWSDPGQDGGDID